MQFLLTGVDKEGLPQNNPHASIGGYVSSTLVPNGGLNTLFPALSLTDMLDGRRTVRAIVVKNDTESEIAIGSKLHYEKDVNAYSNWRMAIVELALDDCGYYMEKLVDDSALPSVGTFIDNDCNVHQIEFPVIPAGGVYGIWIERTVNVNKAKDNLLDCTKLNEQYEAGDVQQVMTIETVADVADSLLDSWFLLRTPTAKFQFFFNPTTNTVPTNIQSGYEPVRIPHTTGMTATTAATNIWKVMSDVLLDRGELESIVQDDDLNTLTLKQPGLLPGMTDGTGGDDTGFTFDTITPGSSALVDSKTEATRILFDTP